MLRQPGRRFDKCKRYRSVVKHMFHSANKSDEDTMQSSISRGLPGKLDGTETGVPDRQKFPSTNNN